jgi:hypothetical protein
MKQHRTEVIKIIRQQMEAETDPQKKVEYAKQLAKLLPRPRQARRPRKAVEAATPSKRNRCLRDLRPDLNHLNDGKLVQFHLITTIEKKFKPLDKFTALTKEQKQAFFDEALAQASPKELAAYEALSAETEF